MKMSNLLRCVAQTICRNSVQINRNITTTSTVLVKEIHEKVEKNALILEAAQVPSPRADRMLNEACGTRFCPECTLGLDIKHTDVLILSQYVRSDGCMLPRRITGLCHRQQKRIGTLVTMAQKAGLMPNLAPAWSKKDPKKRFGWRKFNKYYLEETIKY
ncbi:PREDICTED: 28S ribosomal protein S18a, mitochondrial [Bactrocera latifrons]|uniref:Large ribosomal subunit protein mL66 n=1 Tax=Bactrocera latifrons TaxID=174628 RepID=A0A0K8V4D5_BACLA|nr:PREDICTED: 28S ribosomal protein S18a, mitochondrial [Bactrocera latifrons]